VAFRSKGNDPTSNQATGSTQSSMICASQPAYSA